MTLIFNERKYNPQEVLLRVRKSIGGQRNLPEVPPEDAFTDIELQTIFSYSYFAYHGMGSKKSIPRLLTLAEDIARYRKTGELPFHVLRVDECLQEKSPHLTQVPERSLEIWKEAWTLFMSQQAVKVPDIEIGSKQFERFFGPDGSLKLKTAPSP